MAKRQDARLDRRIAPGEVWLVGAGPGDPGLLTLYAVRALEDADVVVYDALVDEACLAMAREGALLEYAGKRGGKPSPKQRDISLRLVDLARAGQRVVRLKGGDPFVFGRGGEEALTLVEHGVPFRIVPGITAGVGGAAYAGIPVTHRDTNQVVTFLTGHDAAGSVPGGIDWDAIAKGSPVIVAYMAIRHIETICGRLLAAGRRADEPLAFVSDAATERQRVVVTTLGIVGGLSILGTTGIVNPFSCASWIHSIHRGIDVARAAGLDRAIAATGSTSEAAARGLYPGVPEFGLLDMGDFAGGTLKYLREHPLPRLVLAGGFAKMTKLAQGALDLHSGRSTVDLPALASLVEGPSLRRRIEAANTAAEALSLASAEGIELGTAIAARARERAVDTLRGAPVEVETIVVDRAGAIVGREGA